MVTLAFDKYGLSVTDLHAIWGEHIYDIEGGKNVFPFSWDVWALSSFSQRCVFTSKCWHSVIHFFPDVLPK